MAQTDGHVFIKAVYARKTRVYYVFTATLMVIMLPYCCISSQVILQRHLVILTTVCPNVALYVRHSVAF